MRRVIPIAAAVLAAAVLTTAIVTAPRELSAAERADVNAQRLDAYIDANKQTLEVPETVVVPAVARDIYSATAGINTLAASGTNHDWARIVLLSGGWPMSDNNVAVITRWMRQENGTDDWWNRNNPLNSGYGSGGGGGLGSYANLTISAQKVAELLSSKPVYSAIVAGLASSASPDVTERAIWASPWASSHYANGGHWSSAPVPVVKAPEGLW